jgi:hypothetical protein
MADDPRHFLSGEMVLKEAWSVEDNAITIIPSGNTQFSVELSAADGDNVMTIPKGMILEQQDGAASCVGMKTVCLFGSGVVSVSPSDEGDDFVEVKLQNLAPATICARRIKIEGTGKLVLQAV